MTTTTREFTASPARVFAVLVDPDTYPEWLVGAKNIRRTDPTWPAPGSKFHHVVGFGPLAIADDTTSKAFVQDTMLELLVKVRPILEATVRFEIEPRGTGSKLTMLETPAGAYKLVAPVAEPLIRLRNERSLARLAGVVDRRGPG